MKRAPITKQRSNWEPRPDWNHLKVWERRVHDGLLRAFVADPDGPEREWHLSISHRPAGKSKRYPTWDEIAHARYELIPHDLTMVMVLPPPEEYVAVDDTTFHLHQERER